MRVSSSLLARWYVQIATCLEAGLTLERAVATIPGPSGKAREALRERLLSGDGLEQALERGAPWLPAIDRQLIAAGGEAGRLPDMLKRLAGKHDESAAAGRRAIAAMLYPMFVAHFAVFALPFGLLISGPGLGAYLTAVARILVPFWLLVVLLIVAVRTRFRPVTVVLDHLPLIGAHRRFRAIADLAFVLQAEVLAGVRFDSAWLRAAQAAGDPRLERLASRVADTVRGGGQVSTALREKRNLPPPFVEFWENGEATGQLDGSLGHLYRHFSDLSGRKLSAASFVYPKLLFALIAVWVAMQIIRFYGGYFRQFEELM